MRGYKKSGFFKGLIGDVTNCDIKGFEHLYRITFKGGASVITAFDDMELGGFIEIPERRN